MSVFSAVNALAVYFVVIILIGVLVRYAGFVNKYGVSVLLLVFVAASIRLILPIEIPFAYVVPCPMAFLGPVSRFLSAHPGIVKAIMAAWALGAAVVLVREALRYCRTLRECRSYLIVEDERVQEIARRYHKDLRVLVSPDVDVAFVLNGIRPTIYLPADEVSEQKIELTLAHEAQHVRNHDAFFKLAFVFLRSAIWWLVPIHSFQKRFEDLLELRCDAKVMDSLGQARRGEYVEYVEYMLTLTDAGRRALEYREALIAGKSMAVKGKSSLECRVKFMEACEKKSPRMSPVAAALVVAVFLASYLVVVQPEISPPGEEFQNNNRDFYQSQYDDPMNDGGKSSTFIWKESDGRYQLFVNYEFSRYLTEAEAASEQYQNVYIFEEGSNE